MNVSVIILTKNEEKNIIDCLESVQKVSDDIIVVDDNSQDKTQKLVKETNAHFYSHPLKNDFSQQRNWAMQHTKHSWILFVDADEIITEELAKEIIQLDESTLKKMSAFFIPRHEFWQGNEVTFGEVFDASSKGFARLVQKGTGEWEGAVHETWQIKKGGHEHLHHPLHHFPHQTVSEFLEEINYYSTVRAKELYKKKVPVTIFHICFYPLAKFIVSYFFLLGFLNGASGFVYCFMMSFHSFLVRGKLYQYYYLKNQAL